MQQKMDVNQREIIEDMTAWRKEMETNQEKIDANHERIMACLGKTEATDLEVSPEELVSRAQHQEVPKKDTAVETGRAPNNRHRGQHLITGAMVSRKKGRNWSLPTGGQPAVQKWHDTRETSSGRIKIGTTLQEEPQEDGCSGRDVG
jgi:hypothetical protein